jgi:IS30 family transposase
MISREMIRHRVEGQPYDVTRAGNRARARRFQRRKAHKLGQETVLFGVVEHFPREGWVPRTDYRHDEVSLPTATGAAGVSGE